MAALRLELGGVDRLGRCLAERRQRRLRLPGAHAGHRGIRPLLAGGIDGTGAVIVRRGRLNGVILEHHVVELPRAVVDRRMAVN